MILLIDAGNTRIKWRILHAGAARASGALPTLEVAELAQVWQQYPLTQALISCVASAAVQAKLTQMLERLGVHPHWLVAEREKWGLNNLYEDPAKLGSDRYACLIAAARLKVGDCVVVSVGTATTVDMLSREAAFVAASTFLGGVIIPGPDLMRSSLFGATAQVESRMQHSLEMMLHAQPKTLPRDTDSAVGIGVALAQAGVVHAMCERLQIMRQAQTSGLDGLGGLDRLGRLGRLGRLESLPPRIILTGGARAQVRDWLRPELIEIEDLVLEGLAWIALETWITAR
jgi:type III pantothenate kinase